jgi:hypothetical protein
VDVAQPLAGKNIGVLLQVKSPEPGEGVLQVGARVRRRRGEVTRCDVEKLEDLEELLGRERARSAFDLAEAALGQVESTSELRLRPAALLAQLLDLAGDERP